MALTPPEVVTAPEPLGQRYGLFRAVYPIDLPFHGQAGGVTYEPVSCGHANRYPTVCHGGIQNAKVFDSCENEVDAQTYSPEQYPCWIDATPFVVYGSVKCGSAGTTPEQMEARARRNLLNGEQREAETGLNLVLAAGVLAAGTTLVPADPTITGVVGELETWLYTTAMYGNVGYLHAPARLCAYAMAESLVVPDGQRLRTQMGTIWVFGGGYPDDDTIYISGRVALWRSPDVVVPPAVNSLNLITNEYRVLAERPYAVAYDCHVAAAAVDWTPPS